MTAAVHSKSIDQTRKGVLLVFVGSLLNWIPGFGAIGGLLSIAGIVYVVGGRKGFGRTHARSVVLGVGALVGGIAVGAVAAAIFAFSITQATPSAVPDRVAIEAAAQNLVFGLVAAAALIYLSIVLFAHALEGRAGRLLLWAGLAAGVAAQFLVVMWAMPLVAESILQAFVGGSYDPVPLRSLDSRLETVEMVNIAPYLLFAAAYYMLWQRINRGEVQGPPLWAR